MVRITASATARRYYHRGTHHPLWVALQRNPTAQKILIATLLLVVALKALSTSSSVDDHLLLWETADNEDVEWQWPRLEDALDTTDDATAQQQEQEQEQAAASSQHQEQQQQQLQDTKHAIFVLSLPNNYNLVLPRYFECLGFSIAPTNNHNDNNAHQQSLTMGRYWRDPVPNDDQKWHPTIGFCLRAELQRYHESTAAKDATDNDNFPNIIQPCGNFDVWLDVHYLEGPKQRGKGKQRPPRCFDPVLYPDSLQALAHNYAAKGATIVNVIRSAEEWYASLPPDLPAMWNEWCNPTHNHQFPTSHNKPDYIQFYHDYRQRLVQFAQEHPKWNYIEIDLQESTDNIQAKLDRELVPIIQQMKRDQNVPSSFTTKNQCWSNSVGGTLPTLPASNKNDKVNPKQRIPPVPTHQLRPNDWQLPMLITGLPKSGTTTVHDYFTCAIGVWATAHQWVLNTTSNRVVAIGDCLRENLKRMATSGSNQNTTLLQSCGHHTRIYSDIGILRWGNKRSKEAGVCFYPTLHQNALQAFYDMAPYGTILHLVRDATAWYQSTKRWHGKGGLTEQWSKMKCEGFPPPESSQKVWEAFYNDHNQRIRQFVQDHPTMHYLEIPLAQDTGQILQAAYGFSSSCWGHANQREHKEGKKKKE